MTKQGARDREFKAKKKPPLESEIVDAILKYLAGIPGVCAAKRHGSPYGIRGEPDITGAIRLSASLFVSGGAATRGPVEIAHRFEIEVKRPGETSTPGQIKRQEYWRRCGASVIEADSVGDVQLLIDGLVHGIMPGDEARRA